MALKKSIEFVRLGVFFVGNIQNCLLKQYYLPSFFYTHHPRAKRRRDHRELKNTVSLFALVKPDYDDGRGVRCYLVLRHSRNPSVFVIPHLMRDPVEG
jgi:hypothetical protein